MSSAFDPQKHLEEAGRAQEKYLKLARNPYVSTLDRNLFATARTNSRPSSARPATAAAPSLELRPTRPSSGRPKTARPKGMRTPQPAWNSSTGAPSRMTVCHEPHSACYLSGRLLRGCAGDPWPGTASAKLRAPRAHRGLATSIRAHCPCAGPAWQSRTRPATASTLASGTATRDWREYLPAPSVGTPEIGDAIRLDYDVAAARSLAARERKHRCLDGPRTSDASRALASCRSRV